MCQVKNHPNKDAVIVDLQSYRTYNPCSEESKQMFHNMGNVECFELCEISSTIRCSHCLRYWTGGIVLCTCGTCLMLKEWKTMTQSSKGSNKAKRTNNRRKPLEVTKILADVLTRSRVRTIRTSQRGKSGGCTNTIGSFLKMHKVEPLQSDCSDAVRTIRALRQKEDQKSDPPIPASQQIRQRPEWGNQWRWNTWSSSASSSTNWRGPSTWRSSPKWEEHHCFVKLFARVSFYRRWAIPL